MKNSKYVLDIYEVRLYLIVWITAVGFSIHKVYLEANDHFIYNRDIYGDFDNGWSWINRPRDISDLERRTWFPFMITLIPWLFLHVAMGQVIKFNFKKDLLCFWYILISFLFMFAYFGLLSTICILLQPCFLFLSTRMRKKYLVWILHIAFLFVLNHIKNLGGPFHRFLRISYEKHYLITLAMYWIHLRSLSYDLDLVSDSKRNRKTSSFGNLLYKLAYCLYLPTLFLGPVILYSDFISGVSRENNKLSIESMKRFSIQFVRYTFWAFFTDFITHYIYFNAFASYIDVIRELDSWTLYGLGYCMGQYFLLKYVIVYGLSGTICELDGICAPAQPKCIGRIHLYSDMWKHFDRGLYKFLVKYIHLPIISINRLEHKKFFGALLCFSFIFLWHGIQLCIFVWSTMNFFGVMIEHVATLAGKSKAYKNIQKKYLSASMAKRFNCLLAAPLLAMSALSNFYFFGGQYIGDIYLARFLRESWTTLLYLWAILYCCCHVSSYIKEMEQLKNR